MQGPPVQASQGRPISAANPLPNGVGGMRQRPAMAMSEGAPPAGGHPLTMHGASDRPVGPQAGHLPGQLPRQLPMQMRPAQGQRPALQQQQVPMSQGARPMGGMQGRSGLPTEHAELQAK